MGERNYIDGPSRGGFVNAEELRQAVANGLLTQEEARTVYWSQFPEIRQRAAATPPPIEAVAA